MRPGDIVFAKRGIDEVVGYGFVAGDYQFDGTRNSFRHLRGDVPPAVEIQRRLS
jgi:5-methylcytosine-specific restriction protein B